MTGAAVFSVSGLGAKWQTILIEGGPAGARTGSAGGSSFASPSLASRLRSRTWMPTQGEATATVLLRHGQTSMSVQKRYAGRSDVPLTDTGERQAAAAAKRLVLAGLSAIVSSPLQRAMRTAEWVATVTGVPVVADEGFRETDFGAWEGLTFAEVKERWPSEMTTWLTDPMVAPPGGESFAEVSERVTAALHRVLAGRERQRILIVSHVTPIKMLVAAALLAPPPALYRMHLDVAALCEIDWYADGPAVLRSFNDTAHLSR